jgi:16S rRNA (cytidine1402-2'-O)-methyltransferase
MGTLYIVGTPIGNLEDITLRALRILKEADGILCEDTRVTKKLLSHFGIVQPLISYHQHSTYQKREQILDLLKEGKNVALVCDAGTPGISDPGNELIAEVVRLAPDVNIVPIPGSCALTAAASIAGFPMDKFVFLGFPPQKKKRKQFFEEVAQAEHPVIFYESPYRILKTLGELQTINYKLQVVVGRELTKKFETVYRGTIGEVAKQLQGEKAKGEFVVVCYPRVFENASTTLSRSSFV